jgi:hypothetical protein
MLDPDRAPEPAFMLDDIAGTNGIAVDLHGSKNPSGWGVGAPKGGGTYHSDPRE